jgi:SPP1 family predicted phage head-tail adaptor
MRRTTIGRLRHRLALEAANRTPDGGGGASESWTTVADVWAVIAPTGGTEVADFDALTGRVSHKIVFRYRTGVAPAMRLRNSTRLFEIAAVIDIDERRRWLKCLCVERDL